MHRIQNRSTSFSLSSGNSSYLNAPWITAHVSPASIKINRVPRKKFGLSKGPKSLSHTLQHWHPCALTPILFYSKGAGRAAVTHPVAIEMQNDKWVKKMTVQAKLNSQSNINFVLFTYPTVIASYVQGYIIISVSVATHLDIPSFQRMIHKKAAAFVLQLKLH